MAGTHLIVRPHLKGCQSLASDRLLAKDRFFQRVLSEEVLKSFRKLAAQRRRIAKTESFAAFCGYGLE
jgi:hypothetical protein